MRRALLLIASFGCTACQSTADARLEIYFPDDQARVLVTSLEIWAFPEDAARCPPILDGRVALESLAESSLARVVLDYPLADGGAGLKKVPVGKGVFVVEGKGDAGQVYVRGCENAKVRREGSIEVIIRLIWICRPAEQEICGNTLDDDCDGDIDEDCEPCEIDQDCEESDPCAYGFCLNRSCHYGHFPDNTPCSDGFLCTTPDVCTAGKCGGQTKDCSGFDSPCRLGVCNALSGLCETTPRNDGLGCDDKLWCTENDQCVTGECVGTQRLCNDNDTCTADDCDEGAQSCAFALIPIPGAEGPPEDASCTNGVDDDCDRKTDDDDPNCAQCINHSDCDDQNPCTDDTCLDFTCTNAWLLDDSPCSDAKYCTVLDHCESGVCVGAPRSCSGVATPCEDGLCLESEKRCATQQRGDGEICDDDLWCTVGNQCASGTCISSGPRDCDDSDSCTADACDETNDRCTHALVEIPDAEGPPGDLTCTNLLDDDCDGNADLDDPDCLSCTTDPDCDDGNQCTIDTCAAGVCTNDASTTDTTACDDGEWCTVGDQCQSGACVASARDCSSYSDLCNDGRCNEDTDTCFAEKKANGTGCDDGLFCTLDDQCTEGVCAGPSPHTCNDDEACTVDTCVEASDDCSNTWQSNPGAEGPPLHSTCSNGADDDCDTLTDMDDDDCYDCQLASECDDNNSCTTDTCELGVCQNAILDGTPCDDGAYCTVNDQCSAGSCAGAARDCSAFADACHDGACNEDLDECYAAEKLDGTGCDDGDWCTVTDQCTGGTCGGTARDCSSLSDACNDGVCNEFIDQCEKDPLGDGTPCGDGLWCTENDECTGGTCGGSDKTCDDGSTCTTDACDEDNNQCVNTLVPNPGAEGPFGDATCGGGADEDCDGLIDAADPDCQECTLPGDCDDSNVCTLDDCVSGGCVNDASTTDGNPCDDGDFCSDPDTCAGGICDGPARDCGSAGDTCHDGVCNETLNQCEPQQMDNGTACDDGLWCTTGDTCTNGACAGSNRDCGDSDPCTLDVCDEGLDQCDSTAPGPRPDLQDICGDSLDQDCDGIVDGCCRPTTVSYALKSTVPIEDGSWFIITADFNEDGIPDLATANRGTHAVNVLLGNGVPGRGDGTFAAAVSYGTGDTPYHLAAADFNADTILDFAVAERGGNSVGILLGQGTAGRGDGTFAARTGYPFPANKTPAAVVSADFNADGILDVASANWDGDDVAVLTGDGSNGKGDGTFTGPTLYSLAAPGSSPRSLVAGDFDSDGILDLAVALWNGAQIGLLFGGGSGGKGDGSFGSPATIPGAASQTHIMTADFNEDGILDLVATAMGANTVVVILGQGDDGRGDGTFAAPVSYPTGSTPVSVDARDLNADGISDLAVADWGSATVSVLLGNGTNGRGNGTFAPRTSHPVGTNPAAALAVDATGDGILDLAACNYGSDDMTLIEGQGSAGVADGSFHVFAAVTNAQLGPSYLVCGDFSADALLDFAVVHHSVHRSVFYEGLGTGGRPTGTFAESDNIWISGSGPRGLAVGDVDGDRIQDLVVSFEDFNNVRLFTGAGSGGQGLGYFEIVPGTYDFSTAPQSVVLGDFNGDTLLDAGVTGANGFRTRLGLGTDGVPTGEFSTTMSTVAIGAGPLGAALGDLNGDAFLDAAVSNSLDDTVRIILGVGSGSFTLGLSYGVGDEPVDVQVVDLNRDGKDDIAVANRSASTVTVLLAHPTSLGVFIPQPAQAVDTTPEAIRAADLNADSWVDLVTVNSAAASVSILIGNGDGTFLAADHVNVGGTPVSVTVGQFDWDGRIDLAVADVDNSRLVILRGGGICTPP